MMLVDEAARTIKFITIQQTLSICIGYLTAHIIPNTTRKRTEHPTQPSRMSEPVLFYDFASQIGAWSPHAWKIR